MQLPGCLLKKHGNLGKNKNKGSRLGKCQHEPGLILQPQAMQHQGQSDLQQGWVDPNRDGLGLQPSEGVIN